MTDNWLQEWLAESVRKNLCTKIYCGTCGALEFRRGVLQALMRSMGKRPVKFPRFDWEKALLIAKALAGVRDVYEDVHIPEAMVRCVMFDLWSGIPFLDNEIQTILHDSWAGDVLHRMKEHHKIRQIKRCAHEEYLSPENVRKRHEEKRRLKQEQHQHRLEVKKERDRIWHEKQGTWN